MQRLLVQTQLSNYDTQGRFILECDSGWNMVMGRVREMLRLNSALHITVMCPCTGLDGRPRQVITDPYDVNADLWQAYGPDGEGRLEFFEHAILPNALATRFDFDWTGLAVGLDLGMQRLGRAPRWDAVYINDPMHLRNFRALFHVVGGYTPRFYVHSHFIDNPGCPKFPVQASLWHGQCEAAIRSDFNFWQCESAMQVFFNEMRRTYVADVVEDVDLRSAPWDDGYSVAEIRAVPNMQQVRFDVGDLLDRARGRCIIFVPNRIGGRGRSSDYTNCGRFMFDVLPALRQRRDDFIVLAGNPSQKFSNEELAAECGPNGYVNLVPGALNRDEFRLVASLSNVAVGLYDQDSYGGTAARECVELGALPLWIDNYEYATIAAAAGGYPFLARPDLSDVVDVASRLIDHAMGPGCEAGGWRDALRTVVRERCSYESTTPYAMRAMGLLPDP